MPTTRWLIALSAVAALACWPAAAPAALMVSFSPNMAVVAPGGQNDVDIVVTESTGGNTIFGYDFFLTLVPKDAQATGVSFVSGNGGDALLPPLVFAGDVGPVGPYDPVFYVSGTFGNAGDQVPLNVGDIIATLTFSATPGAMSGYNLQVIDDPGQGLDSAVYATAGAVLVPDTTFVAGMVLTPEPGSVALILAGAMLILGPRPRRYRPAARRRA
jgi:hypothetical protein